MKLHNYLVKVQKIIIKLNEIVVKLDETVLKLRKTKVKAYGKSLKLFFEAFNCKKTAGFYKTRGNSHAIALKNWLVT